MRGLDRLSRFRYPMNPWTWWLVDPSTKDVAAKTQRYGEGEIAETIFFGMNAYDDLLYNVTGRTAAERSVPPLTWENVKPGGAFDQWHWNQWKAMTKKVDGWFGGVTGGGMIRHDLPALGSPL